MQFLNTRDGAEGIDAMAQKVIERLKTGEVLWLICGGSSIPLAVQAMQRVRESVSSEELQKLTVGQTDERYGEVGHKDSNWQQMIEAGFDFTGVKTLPILSGASLEETVHAYAATLELAFAQKPYVVAQFGIGADGHIAELLPHTIGLVSTSLVVGYEAGPYTRISITPPAFASINAAHTFAFGEAKHETILKLRDTTEAISDMPCQLLKQVPESNFYSDQLR